MVDLHPVTEAAPNIDFFISYTAIDEEWAEWIAACLEEDGYKVVFQKWDCRPGHNFGFFMHLATLANRTIMVLSDESLRALYTQPEWIAAFVNDPGGIKRKLIPVRIKLCDPGGLLKSIVYIDLVKVDEINATRRLLDGVRDGRAKPNTRPPFPGLQAVIGCPTCGRPISDNA